MFSGLTFGTGQPINALVSEEDCVSHSQLSSVASVVPCVGLRPLVSFFLMTQQKQTLSWFSTESLLELGMTFPTSIGSTLIRESEEI